MRKLIPAVLVGLFSLSAFAGQYASDKVTFESLDKNADQKLSRSEVAADQKLAKDFSKADKNSDGFLSRDEFNAYNKA